jgi:hypothetical protein
MISVYGQIQMTKQMPANKQLINRVLCGKIAVLISDNDQILSKNQTTALFKGRDRLQKKPRKPGPLI